MAVSARPDEYRGPVILALVLHASIILLLSLNLSFCERDIVLLPVPAHVKAVLVERVPTAPVAAPAAEPVPEPVSEPVPIPVVQPEPPKPKPLPPKPVVKPVPKKPVPKPVVKALEPKIAAKPAPKEKPQPPPPDFSAMLDQEENALATRDAVKKAASQQAQRDLSAHTLQDQKTVNEYTALIRIEVEKRWSRPPSARTGMQAELRITLIPGGEVLEVQLVKSSGDPAFDRSAENAVRLAGRLPVPGDPAVFSNYFRQFKFLFRPEGLRQ